MIFKDRIEAGHLLSVKLEAYKGTNAVVLAIPRGGVPLGYVVAKNLQIPLEIVLSKKIGHPFHKEFAIGAVTLKSRILSDASKLVSTAYIEEETEKIRTLLKKRYEEYHGARIPVDFTNRTLIIVDDGIATGNTILSTIEMLHQENPAKIIVAVPVSSQSALQKLKKTPFVDEVVCLSNPLHFQAVGEFYVNFEQVSDDEVQRLLKK